MREQARRLVALGESRVAVFDELLEPLSIAAAVDTMTFMEWRGDSTTARDTRGPYGRRDIGALVGASPLIYKSERYCYLHSKTHHGLPHLLADYLTVYAEKVLLGGHGSID